MKPNEQNEIALEMAISRAIDAQLDVIVQKAVWLAAKLQGSGMRENQLRNVLDTALHTESLELVANFIRYQIGRGRDWQHNNFGECVVATFEKEGVIDVATGVVIDAIQKDIAEGRLDVDMQTFDSDPLADRQSAIRMKLARRLLAEMNRAFLYADRAGGWDKLKPVLDPVVLTSNSGASASDTSAPVRAAVEA